MTAPVARQLKVVHVSEKLLNLSVCFIKLGLKMIMFKFTVLCRVLQKCYIFEKVPIPKSFL